MCVLFCFLSKSPLMVVDIFWNAKSVFLHFCQIQCLYFCHTVPGLMGDTSDLKKTSRGTIYLERV